MDKIYHKYISFINIRKLKAYKHKFKDPWTLWYHKIFDNEWTINSYKKLYTFNNIAEFWQLYNNHIYLSNGMFFLMQNDILPIYEDENNINGGYWSLKVTNDNVSKIWLYLSLDLIGGKLDKKKIVSGLSISYKKKFYIIKIWIKNKNFNDIRYLDLEDIDINKDDMLYNNFSN
tara:strand:- start:3335 stop:3856 length:522 start_codon:yes stop_codon:yes gene_type:complete